MHKIIAKLAIALYLFWLPHAQAATVISSARVWPALEYTRLTLESKQPVRYNMFTVKDPERLVIDLEDVDITDPLNGLAGKVGNDDPYIKSVRVGRFKPGVTRLVLDLKAEVKPQLFNLKPVAEYGHRLVLDIYPAVPIDPLMALVLRPENRLPEPPVAHEEEHAAPALAETKELPGIAEAPVAEAPLPTVPNTSAMPDKAPATGSPEISTRTLIIAIDAGHGGEDPGAQGRRGTFEKNVTLAIARKLKELVDETPEMRGVLIRDGDYFIPLGGRVAKARQIHADLFISIHADAFVKSDVRGSSVFALS